jgi:hypothetical protein
MTSNSGANRAGQAAARARSSVKADADDPTGRRDGSASTEQTKKETVRLSLDVSVEFNALITELATESNSTKSDVLRRAVTLLRVASEAKKQGKKVGIAEKDQPLATEIIWL